MLICSYVTYHLLVFVIWPCCALLLINNLDVVFIINHVLFFFCVCGTAVQSQPMVSGLAADALLPTSSRDEGATDEIKGMGCRSVCKLRDGDSATDNEVRHNNGSSVTTASFT